MRFAPIVLASTLIFSVPAVGAPVAGFESYYADVVTSCTVPVGTRAACETAINAYATVLVATVELDEANASFSALRKEVYDINNVSEENEQFRDEIDALFELLLPESGAVLGEQQSL
jgi:vacuolar-type H+-ATPase subunit D/Vma8